MARPLLRLETKWGRHVHDYDHMAGHCYRTDGRARHHHHPFPAVRAFPESKKPPRIVDYLGNVLPYAMIGLLVVYSLKNVNPLAESHGIPEAIAIAVIVILHIWKRNMLLSIAGGTALYMVLLQLVFV